MKGCKNWCALAVLVFSSTAFAQTSIPPGTVLSAELNSSLSFQKSKPGQLVTARVMQDVPISPGQKIRAGTRIVGQVVSVTVAHNNMTAEITFRFDTLQMSHDRVPINTNLRALASAMEVEDAQIPPTGSDRGTPWSWTTRTLIGGEVAYGEGGPVARGSQIVGRALANGVLVRPEANRAEGCSGAVAANDELQALWVFSSDACGVYGIPSVRISHAGWTNPAGLITLASNQNQAEVKRGSGILLQVNATSP